jgi:hypothetical protein
MSFITIDFYNKNIYVRLNEVSHGFANLEIFELGTGFSHEFPTAKIVTIESSRNMFVVERDGGETISGRDVPEIAWLFEHEDEIVAAALEDIERGAPSVTVRDIRTGRLFATDWLVVRHSEQVLMSQPTSLTQQQMQDLHNYRQSLRNIPDQDLSLDGTAYNWPEIPAFVPSL